MEVLVAVAILGLAAALSTAAIGPRIEAARFHAQANDALESMRHLRTQALLERRTIVFDPSLDAHRSMIGLPADIRAGGDVLTFFQTGLCSGGRIWIVGQEGRRRDIVFQPPHCVYEGG